MSSESVAAAPLVSRGAILIADDHELVREGLKAFVASFVLNARFVEADDGRSLLHVASQYSDLELALVDLAMPYMQGGQGLLELSQRRPSLPVVVVSALSSPDIVRRVQALPMVCAFVPKSAGADLLRTAVAAAMRGQKLSLTQVEHAPAALPGLTSRQAQIHGLVRQGLSNKVIAATLGITEGTVKNHVSEVLRALHATNRTQAARYDPYQL